MGSMIFVDLPSPHSCAIFSSMSKTPKRPRDVNQLAKSIVDIATGNHGGKQPAPTDAISLARLGGLKGGRARAEKLSPERRAEIAKHAAQVRYKKS
jgi:hypothetical protein